MTNNVIPFKPRRQQAGTSIAGESVGGRFATALHSANDTIVLGAAATETTAVEGPLRTVPQSLLMSYDVEEKTVIDLVFYLQHSERNIDYGRRVFAGELDCDEAEAKRLFLNAYAFRDDFESLEAACYEAAAYASGGRPRDLVAGKLESQILAVAAEVDDVNGYARRGFMDALPYLDRPEAEELWNASKAAVDNGASANDAARHAARANADAHPGGKTDPDYIPPGAKLEPGYGQGTLSTGSNFEGFLDATEVAARVRAELKRAQAANYLPAGVTFSVTRDKYSGGQSVNVVVRGIPDSDRLDPVEKNQWNEPIECPEALELVNRVDSITNAWNRQDTDSSSDYYNVAYSSRVSIETDRGREFREAEAEAARARKAAKAS